MDEILEILEKDARMTPKEIAKMTGKKESTVGREQVCYRARFFVQEIEALCNEQALFNIHLFGFACCIHLYGVAGRFFCVYIFSPSEPKKADNYPH